MLEFAKKQQAGDGSSFFELVCKNSQTRPPSGCGARRGGTADAVVDGEGIRAATAGGGDIRAATASGCGGR